MLLGPEAINPLGESPGKGRWPNSCNLLQGPFKLGQGEAPIAILPIVTALFKLIEDKMRSPAFSVKNSL